MNTFVCVAIILVIADPLGCLTLYCDNLISIDCTLLNEYVVIAPLLKPHIITPIEPNIGNNVENVWDG